MKTNDAKNGHIRVPLVQGSLESRMDYGFNGPRLFQLLDIDLSFDRYWNWINELPNDEREVKLANYRLLTKAS